MRLPGVSDQGVVGVAAFLTGQSDAALGATVRSLAKTFGGFLSWFVAPWTDAVARRPIVAAIVLALLFLSLRWSASLQQQIWDRTRAAWVEEPGRNRLMPTGRRGALFESTLFCLRNIGSHEWKDTRELRHAGYDGGPVRAITPDMTAQEAIEAFRRCCGLRGR